jgi:ribosomal protein S18 acetylase RimI-like enzyme
MHQTTTRHATLEDVEILLEMEERCFGQHKEITRRGFRDFIKRPNNVILIAECNGLPRGYALALLRTNSPKARLYSLAVLPEFQGTGMAQVLVSALEFEAAIIGATVMQLEVRETNHKAIRFYQKMGYCAFDRYHEYYEDQEHAWRMSKPIASLSLIPYQQPKQLTLPAFDFLPH